MCFDSDAPESKRLCYVGTDDVEAGRLVMRAVAELLDDKPGVIAILAGNQTATNLQKRVRGAEEELALHSQLQLKKVYYHKETPQDSYAEVESAQKANPEINGWAMIGGWPPRASVRQKTGQLTPVFCALSIQPIRSVNYGAKNSGHLRHVRRGFQDPCGRRGRL
jgi:ABC-type sugar transport system substrate-binding protein